MWVGYSSRARHCAQLSAIYIRSLHRLSIDVIHYDVIDGVNHSGIIDPCLPTTTSHHKFNGNRSPLSLSAGPILLCSAGDAKPSCLDQKHISGGWAQLGSVGVHGVFMVWSESPPGGWIVSRAQERRYWSLLGLLLENSFHIGNSSNISNQVLELAVCKRFRSCVFIFFVPSGSHPWNRRWKKMNRSCGLKGLKTESLNIVDMLRDNQW